MNTRSLAATAVLALAGCINHPVDRMPPSAGSETHWLTACAREADCPAAAACLCGVCTVPCEDDGACAPAGEEARCVPVEDPTLVEACGGAPPPRPVCLADCSLDADCRAGTICTEGRCVAGEAPEPDAGPRPGPTSQTWHYAERPKLDVLILVDDSGSMCEEQATLADGLRSVAGRIAALDARIAVTSTDLRTQTARGNFYGPSERPFISPNCNAVGQPEPEACDAILAAAPFVGDVLAVEPGLSEEGLGDILRCLTDRGTGGDGFEKGLEAIRISLACDGPQAELYAPCCEGGRFDPRCGQALDFLRPDAALLVVIISDEPDCSAPADNPGVSRRAICKYGPEDDADDADAIPDGFNDRELCADDPESCYLRECSGLEPEQCYQARCFIDRGDNNNCLWQTDALTPVSDYVSFLRGLKRWPDFELRVVPIVGPTPLGFSGEPLTWVPGRPEDPACDPRDPSWDPELPVEHCCPNGVCVGGVTPSCESAAGVAFTGERYRELGGAFCGTSCEAIEAIDICDADYRVETALDAIATPLEAVFCLDLDLLPADTRLAVFVGDRVLPESDWRLEEDPACPFGRVRLLRPTAGATYEIRVISAE